MSNIIHFTPMAESAATDNLMRFIEFARNDVKLWSSYDNFNWDNHIWQTHRRKIRFHNYESRKVHYTKTIKCDQLLPSSYMDFTKAYIRYTQNIKQTSTTTAKSGIFYRQGRKSPFTVLWNSIFKFFGGGRLKLSENKKGKNRNRLGRNAKMGTDRLPIEALSQDF